MRKLLLISSSDFFYERIDEFVNKPLSEVNVAWITTAKKESANPDYILKHRKRMPTMPFHFDEIDIEGKTEEELRALLENRDIIYVHGGNTFSLLRAIHATKFKEIVKERLDKGVLYVGSSAGAYVACPTVEMATWKSGHVYSPQPGQGITGMNLVPFLVTVHYEEQYEEDTRKGMKESVHPTRILRDGQALFVDGDNVAFYGDDETTL